VTQSCENDAHSRTTEALLCMSQSHARSLTLQDLLDDVIASVQYVTQADRVCLYMVDEVAGELWAARISNPSNMNTGRCITLHVLQVCYNDWVCVCVLDLHLGVHIAVNPP
jgi:hypothetical protein